MNYPVWLIPAIGGFNLIAIISILHAFVAHFAVGGGLYIWLMELKVQRERDPHLRAYLKRYTWFFLLLTMVFGGLTGVGIWFIIGLVSPQVTSLLIHTFVYGWAIEWVFFIGEIVSLLIYYYKFDQLDERTKKITAFLYFAFAWLSLAVINGILSFMLTPGKWLETKDFWDGFLNPSYLASTLFRSFYAFIVAGIFGLFTASLKKEKPVKDLVIKYSVKLILTSIPFLILSGLWYYNVLSDEIKTSTFVLNRESILWLRILFISSCLIVILSIFVLIRKVQYLSLIVSAVLIPSGLLWLGSFEYLRELARKPYVVYNYMYSNSLLVNEVLETKQNGLISKAKWVKRENLGEGLFNALCLPCHTWNGPNRDLRKILKDIPEMGILAYLKGQGRLYTYMPRLYGKDEELTAISQYIGQRLQSTNLDETEKVPKTQRQVQIPKFEADQEYLLLSWPDLGMHCMTDMDKYFSILPPANTLEAILIKRGEVPELVTSGVKILYEVEKGFQTPSKQSDFWRYVKPLYGIELERDKGLFGKGLKGELVFKKERSAFVSEAIPIVPYREDGEFIPYPLFSIKAIDESSGQLLAETYVVAPVSTEIGCRNCHGGPWRFKGKTGLSEETARTILRNHDSRHKTKLLKEAEEGNPKACAQCHQDPATGMKGKEGLLNLSASIHGFHALYTPFNDERACYLCHPASPRGATQCYRGLHKEKGLVCVDCHGSMEEHAIGLLRKESSKPKASWLLKALEEGERRSQMPARSPWEHEPNCLVCHKDFGKGEIPKIPPISKERLYKDSVDEMGIRCMACHGATHALYPATNPYGNILDNIQPIQYMGSSMPIGAKGTCYVCHKKPMEESAHHQNMLKGPR